MNSEIHLAIISFVHIFISGSEQKRNHSQITSCLSSVKVSFSLFALLLVDHNAVKYRKIQNNKNLQNENSQAKKLKEGVKKNLNNQITMKKDTTTNVDKGSKCG